MKRFWKLITREFRLFGSNSVAFLIFIGAPILYAVLLGFVYKDAAVRDLPIIVVDLDNTPLSNKIIDALDDNQYIKVAEVEHNAVSLKEKIIEKKYHGVVTIPARFEADVQQKRYPEIDVDINGANMLTGNYATTGIQTTLAVLNAGIEIETLKKKGLPEPLAQQQFETFRINVSRFFNPASNYLFFLYPGMLGTIMQQVFLIALALSFTKEYEDNTFRNLLRYTRKPWYLLWVKTLPYWLMGMALWLPLIRCFFAFFRLEMVESLGAFFLVSALFMLAVTFLGIAISIMMTTQLKATEVLMIIATPSFIISGQTWPLSHMPHAIQYVANTIPLTHYLEAFRSLLVYKATYHQIMPQITALLIITGISMIVAYGALRYKIARTEI